MIYILSVINILSFFIFGLDKKRAIQQKRRIPENTLLGISLLGGIIGSASGMIIFNHKTSKKSFLMKFILVVLIDLVLLYRFIRH
ncbi:MULTISPECIES: DUF1294 domain-containing protein [Chryseobacterium]|jgi:Predicted membrane protein|uniref:DUF1294 domain-containing protein n=1 Tax=Chryseobacterium rhizosphaerae TaxID=395937 RepID=A0AAE3YC31_9FLAO|nr:MULTISPECIES: DUF1294 domain-containing protein [Chryseobacterium]MBL3546625.1 DUF1294 domain-containing protein [Chryseobacterium sp. KMC2]MDC8099753.1 DUF1294 domain-containing protein [Chryseobacterium rhizosphaerae]MDR6528670.1 uncharacterized membrane protein YsdA (DUF1294 family) [Chryseobacterium rhizosphaerae]MDR6547320.1 uncharacterized membrane protein YsdA (DUF1294 family) [Chryseobacterium rhizosphaerae]REC72872.1 DUF1294 domain-containing protein [Chryseobacterium rhizosphaerae